MAEGSGDTPEPTAAELAGDAAGILYAAAVNTGADPEQVFAARDEAVAKRRAWEQSLTGQAVRPPCPSCGSIAGSHWPGCDTPTAAGGTTPTAEPVVAGRFADRTSPVHDHPVHQPEPTAAVRHEFVDTDSSVLNADETLWVGVCAVCRSAEDDPVHQPATSSGDTEPVNGACAICGDLDDHFGTPHSIATGDGRARIGFVPCPHSIVQPNCASCLYGHWVRTTSSGDTEPAAICGVVHGQPEDGPCDKPAATCWQRNWPTSSGQAEHGIDTAAVRLTIAHHIHDTWPKPLIMQLLDALDRQREETREVHADLTGQHEAMRQQRDDARARLDAICQWAMVNEIATPPLDWAGLGAILKQEQE